MPVKRILSILSFCVLLSACASISSKYSSQDRLDILNKSLGTNNVSYYIKLDSTGTILSDSFASIFNKFNANPNTKTLTEFLQKSSGQSIAVIANRDEMAVSFIEGAIAGLKGRGSRTCIQFVGSKQSVDHLIKITEKAGIPFTGVVIPGL